jgi:hypothetical protein
MGSRETESRNCPTRVVTFEVGCLRGDDEGGGDAKLALCPVQAMRKSSSLTMTPNKDPFCTSAIVLASWWSQSAGNPPAAPGWA